MKLSTAAIALTLTVASVQAMAGSVTFKQVNANFETQACYTAATEGYSAARKLVKSNGYDFAEFKATLTCNGETLRNFAKQFEDAPASEAKSIAIVAKNTDIASKACVEAIKIGENKALAKYKLQGEVIYCNNKTMSQFVRKYNDNNVVVRDIAED